MISAIVAKGLSDDSNANLTFILDLIDKSILDGKYSILIEDKRMNDDMSNRLRNEFGYEVFKQTFSYSIYDRYKVSWGNVVVPSSLSLTFDNITNADLMISGSSLNVNDWNSFFDLPTYGTGFTSVEVVGNTVNLIGGSGITIKPYLFGERLQGENLLQLVDTIGCIIACGEGVFTRFDIGSGCYNINKIHMPSCITLGNAVFSECTLLSDLDLPFSSYTTLGERTFNSVSVLPQYDFPNLVSAGDFCFSGYYSLIDPNFSNLISAGNYCFDSCPTLISEFPLLEIAGVSCFSSCIGLVNTNFSHLASVGDSCFQYCTGLVNPNFSGLTIVGANCFYGCSGLVNPNFNSLTIAGEASFADCIGLINPDFSSLTIAGNNCFASCIGLVIPDFSSLITVGDSCFNGCTGLSFFISTTIKTIGDGCFIGCTSLMTINLPVLTNLGKTIGDNNVFDGITDKMIDLILPSSLMTCNSGLPDADIIYLGTHNSSIIINGDAYNPFTGYTGNLSLTFNNISNVPVANASSVTDWNTFFNLRSWCTPFSSVEVSGNTVTLLGGENIMINENLFFNNSYLIEVIDTGCVCYLDNYSFFGCSYMVNVEFPNLTTIRNDCFQYCLSLINPNFSSLTTCGIASFADCSGLINPDFSNLVVAGSTSFPHCVGLINPDFSSLISVGENCFLGCYGLINPDFSNLVIAGDSCFLGCYGLINPNFSSLTTAGFYFFKDCTSLTNPNFSSLTTVGDSCFQNCTSLTNINLPVCTNLGTTVGDNSVFLNITGKTITLTVPSALMICNSGQPDGDIQYLTDPLQGNTITIIPIFTYTQLPGGIGQYTQGTSLSVSSPFVGGSGSYSFNGVNGFIEIYPGADTSFGTGDYTIEWFYYENSQKLHPRFFSIGNYYSGATMDCSVENNKWWFGENGGWMNHGESIGGDLVGQWHHFVIVRISGFTSMYKDANLIASFVDNNDLNNTTTPLIISQDNLLSDPNCYINGLISNFRWVKGLGIYTQAGFTVPTGDLTKIASANPYGGNYTQAIGSGYTKYLLN